MRQRSAGLRAAYPGPAAALPGFRVVTVGHIPRKDRPQFTPAGRRLDSHSLFLFHDGSGSWRSERESGRIAAGTLLLFRAGAWQCFDPDPGGFISESWLLVEGALADGILATRSEGGGCRLLPADPVHLAARWQELLDLASQGPGSDLRVASLALDLLVEAVAPARGGGGRDDAIAAFSRCAEEHAADPRCPLPAFLARQRLAFETFRKAFRRRTGLFPRQYWQRRKLDLARAMLVQGGEPVGVIAAACGFADIYHFSRWFRRHAGLAPSSFRARYRLQT